MRDAALVALIVLLGGCRRPAPPAEPATQPATANADRTVFTDSILHAERCAPLAPGEDWRRVCTPLDQGVTPVRPLKPPTP